MKKLIILFFILIIAVPHMTNAATNNDRAAQSFKAGGVSILIPVPSSVFVEAGDSRSLMELFVPQNNRLLSGFVFPEDLPLLAKGGDDSILTKYALVEVPRRGEYMDCGTNDFKDVISGAKKSFGDITTSSLKEAEEEFNRRMESLDVTNAQLSIGNPLQLGCLFSKSDAYGFGMIAEVSMSGKNIKMAMGSALLRVKKRLVFVYLYAEYKNDDTVKWIRKTTEEWSDAILKANG